MTSASVRLLGSLGFLLLSQLARAEPVTAEGFTYIKSLGGFDEYRLDANGLQVLLYPQHSTPVVTFNVTYHVGSRNEVTGTTGATHILEHMMFKGSEHFNDAAGNSVKQYLERVGGNYNANTWFDRTCYFASVGRDNLEGYVAIEADRMRHLLIRNQDRFFEMVVVRNEYERGQNSPTNVMEEQVFSVAFLAQPYHHSTIGWRSDIEKVSIEKLREFYDTFYWPDNATATVIGDFDPAAALALIRKYYGGYSRAPKPIPPMYTEEPEQEGPRRLVLKRPGRLGAVFIGHKIPNGLDADQPALDVLGSILLDGKNSRLYRALVDQSLATNLDGGNSLLHDPGLFTTSVALTPGTSHAEVEKIILAEFDRIKREGVTDDEVRSVLRRNHAQTAYRRDGPAGISAAMVECIAVGDWTTFVTYPEKIQQVTAADVLRVARKYLDEDHSTTGWYVPITPATQP